MPTIARPKITSLCATLILSSTEIEFINMFPFRSSNSEYRFIKIFIIVLILNIGLIYYFVHKTENEIEEEIEEDHFYEACDIRPLTEHCYYEVAVLVRYADSTHFRFALKHDQALSCPPLTCSKGNPYGPSYTGEKLKTSTHSEMPIMIERFRRALKLPTVVEDFHVFLTTTEASLSEVEESTEDPKSTTLEPPPKDSSTESPLADDIKRFPRKVPTADSTSTTTEDGSEATTIYIMEAPKPSDAYIHYIIFGCQIFLVLSSYVLIYCVMTRDCNLPNIRRRRAPPVVDPFAFELNEM